MIDPRLGIQGLEMSMANHPNRKLTPALRRMLERVEQQDGRLLESQITASGGRSDASLNTLLRNGWVDMVDHPTVKHGPARLPAAAVKITEAGRVMLGIR